MERKMLKSLTLWNGGSNKEEEDMMDRQSSCLLYRKKETKTVVAYNLGLVDD